MYLFLHLQVLLFVLDYRNYSHKEHLLKEFLKKFDYFQQSSNQFISVALLKVVCQKNFLESLPSSITFTYKVRLV